MEIVLIYTKDFGNVYQFSDNTYPFGSVFTEKLINITYNLGQNNNKEDEKSMGSTKTILKRATAYALAFVMAFSMLFTGNNVVTTNAAATVTKLTVKKSKVTIDLNAKSKIAKVKVTVKGSNKKFTVKSNKKSIATVKVVKKNAVITGKKVGTAKITVTTKGKNKKNKKLKKTITVTVINSMDKEKDQTAATTVSNAINALPASTTVTAADEAKITEARKTYDALTVDQKALVPADVVKKLTDAEAALTEAKNKVVTSVNVAISNNSINVGATTKATYSIVPATAKSGVKWSSSNTAVATVQQDGTVLGVSDGTSEIVATADNGVTGKVTVTVSAIKVTGVTISPKTITMTDTGSGRVEATVVPQNATNRKVTYVSSDTSVVTVDEIGNLSAKKAGNAIITVKTEDGGFTDKCEVEVTAKSNEDVDGVKIEVTNSIEGYENTVLVGTNAEIKVSVFKNGVPQGNKTVNLTLENTAGYDYYQLSNNLDSITTEDDGTKTISVKMIGGNKYEPVIENMNSENFAYASYTLTAEAGGATEKASIPVSFAQILAVTDKSSYDRVPVSLSVDNDHDYNLAPLDRSNVSGLSVLSNKSKDDYYQEYVVDQQITSGSGDTLIDHTITLDAAPLLLLPETNGGKNKNNYLKENINHRFTEYSVYTNENTLDNAYTLKDVPGGLDLLTLTFDNMVLSPYTRIVVRAYYAKTDEPYLYKEDGDLDGKPIEYTIDSSTVINNSTYGKTVDIGKYVFDKTSNEEFIDLKIFVESQGQVNEDTNEGFVLQKASGSAITITGSKPFTLERLASAVTWTFPALGREGYTGEKDLASPLLYLGDKAKEGNKYKVSVPSAPHVGNAIIIGYNNGQPDDYWLYPTTIVGSVNELYRQDPSLAISGSKEMIQELTTGYTKNIKAGRVEISSTKEGYIPVEANIKVGKLDYTLYSFVQWSRKPVEEVITASDYYALTNQTVTIEAEIRGENDSSTTGRTVKWNNIQGATVNKGDYTYKANADSKVILKLSAAQTTTLEDVSCDPGEGYVVKSLKVGGVTVPTKHANITWVKPNLYYKNSYDGLDYYSDDDPNQYVMDDSQYNVGQKWLIGTKVVGPRGLLDNGSKVVNISNIAISMESSGNDGVTLTNKSNGVCLVENASQKGKSTVVVRLNGLLNESEKCVITVATKTEDRDGNSKTITKDYTSVGEGSIGSLSEGTGENVTLSIPIKWVPEGTTLTMINNNSVYSLKNKDNPKVYAHVTDATGKVDYDDGLTVNYTITDQSTGYIVENGSKELLNGYAEITVPKPNKETTYTIATSITGGIEKKEITFLNNSATFEVESINADVDAQTVAVNLNTEILSKALVSAGFFELYQADGVSKIDIEKVEVKDNNLKTIIITPKSGQTFTSEVVVKVKSSDGNEARPQYFLSKDGVIMTPGTYGGPQI